MGCRPGTKACRGAAPRPLPKRMSINSFHGDEKGVLSYEEGKGLQRSEAGHARRSCRHGDHPQPFSLDQYVEHQIIWLQK